MATRRMPVNRCHARCLGGGYTDGERSSVAASVSIPRTAEDALEGLTVTSAHSHGSAGPGLQATNGAGR